MAMVRSVPSTVHTMSPVLLPLSFPRSSPVPTASSFQPWASKCSLRKLITSCSAIAPLTALLKKISFFISKIIFRLSSWVPSSLEVVDRKLASRSSASASTPM